MNLPLRLPFLTSRFRVRQDNPALTYTRPASSIILTSSLILDSLRQASSTTSHTNNTDTDWPHLPGDLRLIPPRHGSDSRRSRRIRFRGDLFPETARPSPERACEISSTIFSRPVVFIIQIKQQQRQIHHRRRGETVICTLHSTSAGSFTFPESCSV